MPKGSKTKKNRPSRLAPKSRFSSGALAVFILIFAAFGGYAIWRSLAAPTAPSVYLTPSSGVYGVSTSFSVQVRENSGTTAVNAIQANLSYSTTLLTCVSISYTGTAFGTQAQSNCASGSIQIARGTSCTTSCSSVTGDQLVATINFKTTTTGGAASVPFTAGTKLVSSSTNQDLLGSLSNTYGGTYSTDTTPPTVSITAPANNAVLAAGSVVTVSVSASDSQSSVSKVEVYVDGNLSGTVSSSPFNYAWNTSGLTLGAHTLTAKAYDSFNNVATSSTVNVTLTDQTAPSTPGSFKSTGSTTTSISLSWTASTDNVGVTAYKLKRGGTLIATISAPTVTYTNSGLTAGTAYSYTLQATDAAGNLSSAASLNVSTPTLTPGDLNGDGHVDVTDLSILLSYFGGPGTASQGDINGDGQVDVLDLSTLLSYFGT